MGRPLRMYEPDGTYFITARTTQRRLLLRPSAHLNEVIGGILARAAQRHAIEIYAFIFASNHVHLLVRDRDGSLSQFMQYLLGNLARKVGRLHGWSGPFWQRRFSCEPVLDDESMLGRTAYILAHGVKEGLVRRVAEWPGLSSLPQMLGDSTRLFPWFSWTKRSQTTSSAKPSSHFAAELVEQTPLTLSVLPAWQRLSPTERRRRLQCLIETIEAAGQLDHPNPLGPARVCRQSAHATPTTKPERTRRPWCHTVSDQIRKAFRETYKAFAALYREASRLFRAGNLLAVFPGLSFRPPGFPVKRNAVSGESRRAELPSM